MPGRLLRGLWNFITAAKNAMVNLIFLAIVIFVMVALFSSDSVSVPDYAALVIDPSGNIVEQKQAINPMAQFLSGYENDDAETRLKDILDAIDSAATDSRIKILVLDLRKLQGTSFSRLEEIGNALEKFKQSGKSIYAFGKSYSQSQYYIAAHANELFLDKHSHQLLGGVFLTGLGVYPMYYKSALEKLKIRFHIYKAGRYKSAVEPYERDDMSPESKLATKTWLDQLWSNYVQTIVTQREISEDSFNRYTNRYDELLSAAENDPNLLAVQQDLVDDLMTRSEWITVLQDIVGKNGNSYSHIGLQDYLAATRAQIPKISPGSNKIAVITATGTIYDGEWPAGYIGSESISKLIRQAREDTTVKALVMRIDSPGGSASAAEQIRNELILTQEQGKPIVVSMGSYAASGGYWISANANKIFAASTTITGSIGVFATLPALDQAAAELGIHSDGVGTTALSDSNNLLGALNPVFDQAISKSVEFTYKKFINLVASGRNMSPQQVDILAQGRVWSATDAIKHGLVDAIGSLDDAIDSAALLADVGAYEVLYLEKTLSSKEKLLNEILNSSLQLIHRVTGGREMFGLTTLTAASTEVKELLRMTRSPGIYSRCLDCRVTD